MATAYDPNNSTQRGFLAAIALGESGGKSNSYTLGAGGTDLSGAGTTGNYGFPSWGGTTGGLGVGTSHGAGAYQFEPGTWNSIASKYGLNFQNPADQDAGAWYLAQQVYQKKTGGDLETALEEGNYSSVQSALNGTWGTTGNGATPQGLAYDLAHGIGSSVVGGNSGTTVSSGGSGTSSSSSGGVLGTIQSYFVRGGLLLVGGLVVLVALWVLLSRQGAVPSPKDLAKAV